MLLSSHHHLVFPKHFYLPQIFLYTHLNTNFLFTPLSGFWHPPFWFLSLWIWLLRVPHINGILQNLFFYVWFIISKVMSSRFIPIVACIWIYFFLRLNNISWYINAIFCLYIDLSMGIWVASRFFAIVNHATMNVSL